MFPLTQASAQSVEWNHAYPIANDCVEARGVETFNVYNDELTDIQIQELNNPYIGVEHSNDPDADRFLRLNCNPDDAGEMIETDSTKHTQYQQLFFEGRSDCSSGTWNIGLYQCFKMAGRLSFYDYGWGSGGTSAPKLKTTIRVWGADYNSADGYQTFKPRWSLNFDTFSNSQDIKNKDTADCSGWELQSTEDIWSDHGCSGAVFRVYDSGVSEGYAFDPLTSFVELFLLDDSDEHYPTSMYEEFEYDDDNDTIDSQDVRVITVSEKGGSGSECFYEVTPITLSYPCNIDDSWMLFGYT